MKVSRILLILLALALMLTSCSSDQASKNQNNLTSGSGISTVKKLPQEEYKIKTKSISVGRETYKFDILTWKMIDYIKLEDVYALLTGINKVNSVLKLTGDEKKDIKEIFDTSNNKVLVNVSVNNPVYAYSAEIKQANLNVVSNDYKPEYVLEETNLNEFGVSYITDGKATYFPLMLINYCFLSDNYIVIPTLDKSKYAFIGNDYGYDEAIRSYQKQTQPLRESSPELREFSSKYLYKHLERYYPFFDLRKNVLTDINKNDYNNYSPYQYYLDFFVQLDSLTDLHTSLRSYSTPSLIDIEKVKSVAKKSYNYSYFNSKMDLINMNPQFNTSEYKILDNNLGYIRVHSFKNDNQFLNKMPLAFKELNQTKGLIIDLRFNSGGMNLSFNTLISYIIKKDNTLTVHYKRRINGQLTGDKSFSFKKTVTLDYNQPIVLLTNRYSYSAANAVAGLFKDNQLGTIIGEKTNGGGANVVINVLPDGSTFYCSSPSMIYLNKSGSLYELGIEPDIYVEDNFDNGGDAVLDAAIKYLTGTK